MKNTLFIFLLFLFQNVCSVSAGEYFQPTSEELIKNSKYIFIGKIIKVEELHLPEFGKAVTGQIVTIEVRSNLKGSNSYKKVQIKTDYLESASFDKKYKNNDIGVWFIESIDTFGNAKLSDQILGYASFNSYTNEYRLD